MVPPSQKNTIDFDAVKLQRLSLPVSKESARPVSLAQLRQQLIMQLQTSLDAERILGMFFKELQSLVPVDALGYQHSSSDLRLELGDQANHSATYRLSHESE